MKKIVCELCEGIEFTKEGGMFVCQGCGTKYSVEEAKSMMREVEGSAPVSNGTPVTAVPMGNHNQAQIDNILLLASNAYSASNNEETEKYCNRAIELDATCYKAWMLKGKAAGWQSTLQNPRIAEAAQAFKQAVDFAPDDEKEELTAEATEELKRLGLACISLRKNRFSQYPDTEELNGFVSDLKPLIDGLIVLLSKGAEVAQADVLASLFSGIKIASIQFIGMKQKAEAAGVPKEFFAQIAVLMGNAAIEGFKTTTKKYNSDSRPMPNDFKKTMTEVDNCIMLLNMANSASDDDDDDDISRINSKIQMEEFCINMTAYADYSSSYRSWSLTDAAKKARRDNISKYRQSIQEIKDKAKAKAEEERKKAEEEKQARIAAYWEAHADEKAALDAELKDLEEKKEKLSAEISGVDAEIKALDPAGLVPSEEEDNKLRDQIRDLENQRSKLGLFSGKEKKRITEEIASLSGRRDSLKSKIEDEKKARQAEAEKKMEPLKEKKAELQSQLDTVTKRINAINNELTKDPEA